MKKTIQTGQSRRRMSLCVINSNTYKMEMESLENSCSSSNNVFGILARNGWRGQLDLSARITNALSRSNGKRRDRKHSHWIQLHIAASLTVLKVYQTLVSRRSAAYKQPF